MTIRRSLFLFAVLQCLPACLGQPTRPTFTLGMTIEELHKQFGMPRQYYDRRTQRYLATEAAAQLARRLSDDWNVQDVYEFKTRLNTYEFRVEHAYDRRRSRLRPTNRITGVVFELDKPIGEIKTLLADLPEAVALCSQECTIFADDNLMFGGSGFVVQHTNPSPQEIAESGLIAGQWDEDEDRKNVWVKGFELHLKGKRIESGEFSVSVKEEGTPIGVWRSSGK